MNRKKVIDIGLFDKIFAKHNVNVATGKYFETLTAYQPIFTTFSGGIYEALACRAAIHAFANQCSKLKIEISGNDKDLRNILRTKPNPWMTSSQFLYRLATVLETDTTAFIVPILDPTGKKIQGVFPVKPSNVTVKEYMGREYIEFWFPAGKKAVVESEYVGVVTKYQYKDDLFGSGNKPLYPTIRMLDTQDQGIVEGIKNNAAIRFMATLAGVFKRKDIEEARKIFTEQNLQNNDTGVMMFDEKFRDVKQITSNPMYVDATQMQQIKNNLYIYFGANEDVLMNKFNEDSWNAYYEGKIEPFAIQVSEVLTNMIQSIKGITCDDEVILSANRLQYASNTTKLSIVTQLFDRGMLNMDDGREIFQMSTIEGGDKYFIRKEYAEVDRLNEAQGLQPQNPYKPKNGGEGNAD